MANELAIAVGWNAATDDFTPFTSIFTSEGSELTTPGRVPLGSVTTKAASGHTITDGWRIVTLTQLGDPFGYTPHAELADYIELVWGDAWEDLDDADCVDVGVSLKLLHPSGVYKFYNGLAAFPQIDASYETLLRRGLPDQGIADLNLGFTVIAEYTPAEPEPEP